MYAMNGQISPRKRVRRARRYAPALDGSSHGAGPALARQDDHGYRVSSDDGEQLRGRVEHQLLDLEIDGGGVERLPCEKADLMSYSSIVSRDQPTYLVVPQLHLLLVPSFLLSPLSTTRLHVGQAGDPQLVPYSEYKVDPSHQQHPTLPATLIDGGNFRLSCRSTRAGEGRREAVAALPSLLLLLLL